MAAEAVERVRAHRGRLELLGEHGRRIARRLIDRDDPLLAAAIERSIHDTWVRSGRSEGALSFRVHLAPTGAATTVESALLDEAPFSAERLARGLRLALPGVDPRGADDQLLADPQGALLGTALRRLVSVRSDGLVAAMSSRPPALGLRLLALAAHGLALPMREARVAVADLASADDLILVSSADGLLAVESVGGVPLPAPPRGAPARAWIPKLRLRWHELAGARLLPDGT